MKNVTKFLFLSLLFLSFNISSQTIFDSEKVIIDGSKTSESPRDVYAGDLDGDGDIDLVSISFTDGILAWYPNLDGQGDFGEQIIIASSIQQGIAVVIADLDNDGDNDVLGNGVSWYENIDGLGNFVLNQTLVGGASKVTALDATDLDNDGDLDILGTSWSREEVFWFENEDGQGAFGDRKIGSGKLVKL